VSEKLKMFLMDELTKTNSVRGQVVQVVTIPDYIDYFEIELKKLEF